MVVGGAPDYAYSIIANGSGAIVPPMGGAYTAGRTPNTTDVVAVRDANRIVVMATIKVGPGVSIAPASPKVASRATLPLTATGGSGKGYKWKLSDNRSGATLDAATGVYTAGDVTVAAVSDVVEVTDSLGNTASVTIRVDRSAHVNIGGGSGCDCGVAPGETGFGAGSALALVSIIAGLTLSRRRRRA